MSDVAISMSLYDRVTGGLRVYEQRVDALHRKQQQYAREAMSAQRHLEAGYRRMGHVVTSVSLKMTAAGRSIFTSMQSATRATMFWGTAAAAVAAGGGAALLRHGIKLNEQMERYRITLTSVMKSQEKANAQISWMIRFAERTPFDVQGLVSASAQLEAFGINSKKWLPLIGDLAATFGGTTEQVHELVEAMGRLRAGLTGIAFRSLRRFGISHADIEHQGGRFNKAGQFVGDPQTAIPMVENVIRQRFGGMMERLLSTWTGIFSNLQDMFTNILRETTNPLFRRLKGYGGVALQTLDTMRDTGVLGRMTNRIGGGLSVAADKTAEFLKENIFSPLLSGAGFGGVARQIFSQVKGPAVDFIRWFASTMASAIVGAIKELMSSAEGRQLLGGGLLWRYGGSLISGLGGIGAGIGSYLGNKRIAGALLSSGRAATAAPMMAASLMGGPSFAGVDSLFGASYLAAQSRPFRSSPPGLRDSMAVRQQAAALESLAYGESPYTQYARQKSGIMPAGFYRQWEVGHAAKAARTRMWSEFAWPDPWVMGAPTSTFNMAGYQASQAATRATSAGLLARMGGVRGIASAGMRGLGLAALAGEAGSMLGTAAYNAIYPSTANNWQARAGRWLGSQYANWSHGGIAELSGNGTAWGIGAHNAGIYDDIRSRFGNAGAVLYGDMAARLGHRPTTSEFEGEWSAIAVENASSRARELMGELAGVAQSISGFSSAAREELFFVSGQLSEMLGGLSKDFLTTDERIRDITGSLSGFGSQIDAVYSNVNRAAMDVYRDPSNVGSSVASIISQQAAVMGVRRKQAEAEMSLVMERYKSVGESVERNKGLLGKFSEVIDDPMEVARLRAAAKAGMRFNLGYSDFSTRQLLEINNATGGLIDPAKLQERLGAAFVGRDRQLESLVARTGGFTQDGTTLQKELEAVASKFTLLSEEDVAKFDELLASLKDVIPTAFQEGSDYMAEQLRRTLTSSGIQLTDNMVNSLSESIRLLAHQLEVRGRNGGGAENVPSGF